MGKDRQDDLNKKLVDQIYEEALKSSSQVAQI